jgi:acyl-CoA thioester hydrolase
MEYTKNYQVKPEHIDVQNIMDGLYYPFYLESCRHAFIKDVLGFDLEEEAQKGIHMVLSQYTLKFLRSLKKGDDFTVTCTLLADDTGQPRLHFKQTIVCNGKLMTSGLFTGTCVPASGGRAFLPESILTLVKELPTIQVQLL